MSFCERICSSDLTRVHWRGAALLFGAFSSSELKLSDESASALGIHSVGKCVCRMELEMRYAGRVSFFNYYKQEDLAHYNKLKRDLDQKQRNSFLQQKNSFIKKYLNLPGPVRERYDF